MSPTRRSGAAVIGVLAAIMALVAGCGGRPSGLAPATYAHRACTAVQTFETSLTTQATAYGKAVDAAAGNPVPLKAAAVSFLTQQVTGSGTLLSSLTALPAPAGTGGGRVKHALVSAARSTHDTFQTQQATVAATTASDRTAFYAILNTAQQQVTVAGEALATGLESVGQYGDQRLNSAFAADAVCAGLSG